MNRIYRSIWNDSTRTFVATSEIAKSAGKKSSPVSAGNFGRADFMLKVMASSLLMVFGSTLYALPLDGVVAAGSASIASGAGGMTITQASQNAALNWESFSIGAAEAVKFVQPNSSSVALNRVLGADPSRILGRLTANGKVFLVNPNGVLFGQGASVNVGGLVASTRGISDADFMAGRYKFSGAGNGSVVNQGTISAADGGYVALLGASVSNDGVISARLGTVAMGAGNAMTLDVAGDGLLNITLDEGAVQALVNNGGLIKADGGNVFLTAKAADGLLNSVVNNTGYVQAQTVEKHNGVIKLMGDMQSGTVNVGGTLDASAPNGGNGGFIETSAAHVKVAEGAKVTTVATSGQAGNWLIDPTDYTIAAADPGDGSSYMSNGTLAKSLGDGHVTIETLDTGKGNGDIFVNDAVQWNGPNKLTLKAFRDVNVKAQIKSGSNYIPGTSPGAAGDIAIAAGRDILLATQTAPIIDAGLSTEGSGTTTGKGGDVTLTAGARIVGGGSSITTSIIKYQDGSTGSSAGNITLIANGGDVSIGALSSRAFQNDTGGAIGNGGNVSITASGAISVRSIRTSSDSDMNHTKSTTIGNGGFASLIAKNGSVTVNGFIDARAYDNGRPTHATSVGQGGAVTLQADAGGNCLAGSTACSTVIFGVGGSVITSGTGRTDLYYNPESYEKPTDYSSNVKHPFTAWMLVNDIGFESGGSRGMQALNANLSGSYAMGKNIDARTTSTWNKEAGFAPIGTVNEQFSGAFNGQGRTVSGLTINRPETEFVGLFGALGVGSTVQKLGLIGSDISGAGRVGPLAGSNEGTVRTSYAAGTTNGGTYAGGLVGLNGSSGIVQNSYSTGSLRVGNRGGGLVGVSEGSVSDSYSTVSVMEGNPDFFGGLVGLNTGTIERSYATGVFVKVNNKNAGSLVGYNGKKDSVSSSYWNANNNKGYEGIGGGDISGATGLTSEQMQEASSFKGFNFTPTPGATGNNWVIINVDGSLNTDGTPGGGTTPMLASEFSNNIQNTHQLQLMAMTMGGTYTLAANIDAAGTTGTGNVWGSAGFVPVGSSLTNNSFTGSFDGLNHTITGLTTNKAGHGNGIGLFGVIQGANIKNVGLVGGSVTGSVGVGGLVGISNAGSSIRNSFNTGTVTGSSDVGGLVGFNGNVGASTISNSYATGSVSGVDSESIVGGLVGSNSIDGTISNSYATGLVKGAGKDSHEGGLVGRNDGTISNAYWDTSVNTTGISKGTSTGATGLTNTEMKTASKLAGFDFKSTPTWGFAGSANNAYPVLCAFGACRTPAITVYINPITGSSVYGSMPVFSYSFVDANGGAYALADATVSGTALYASAPTSTSNAGNYNFSYGSGLVLGGAGATNYELMPWSTSTAWTVNPRPLGLGVSKIFDGNAVFNAGFTLSGLVNGDTVPMVTGSASVSGSNAGSYNSFASSTLNLPSGNYTLIGGTVSASISQRPLTVTADAKTKVYASTDPTLSYTVAADGVGSSRGLVTGDTLTGALSRTAGEAAGNYAIGQGSVNNPNYDIAYVGANLAITAPVVTPPVVVPPVVTPPVVTPPVITPPVVVPPVVTPPVVTPPVITPPVVTPPVVVPPVVVPPVVRPPVVVPPVVTPPVITPPVVVPAVVTPPVITPSTVTLQTASAATGAIQIAQQLAAGVVRNSLQFNAPASLGFSGPIGNPGASRPGGLLTSIGGLSFVVEDDVAPTGRDQAGGRDAAGFLRVFVVDGGINLAE